jgi:V/A-type H+-transporting ATPase subunit A
MRRLGRFIDLAEAALAAGVEPDRIAGLACLRALQRMGEEIGDDNLAQIAELEARVGREFAPLAPTPEASDAAHG